VKDTTTFKRIKDATREYKPFLFFLLIAALLCRAPLKLRPFVSV